jgi:hypothetical protein
MKGMRCQSSLRRSFLVACGSKPWVSTSLVTSVAMLVFVFSNSIFAGSHENRGACRSTREINETRREREKYQIKSLFFQGAYPQFLK